MQNRGRQQNTDLCWAYKTTIIVINCDTDEVWTVVYMRLKSDAAKMKTWELVYEKVKGFNARLSFSPMGSDRVRKLRL